MRFLLAVLLGVCCFAQEEAGDRQSSESSSASSAVSRAEEAQPPGGNRIFGVLPNYRTADRSEEGTTISARRKLYITRKDSFDYPLIGLSAGLAAMGQWADQEKSFGPGMKGYGHRFLTTYADQVVGNLFTEGVFPAILHEDPRYFRRGSGNFWYRTGYALTRVIVTRKDGGGTRFNYSEWAGSAAAVAISNAYYPDGRTARDNSTKLLQQVGTDAFSQVLKEFWPDIQRKFSRKRAP